MTRVGSTLLPVLRSETQARLLAATLLRPEQEASIADLARRVGADPGNLHSDVTRLVTAGILQDRRVGRVRLIRAGTGPLIRPLQDLLLVAYGPKVLLEEALVGVPGIERAVIFGSWAARYTGQAGPAPHDVDLLVIGNTDRDEVVERVEDVAAHLGYEVQVVFRSPTSWAQPGDSFTVVVRSSALVDLDLLPRNPQGSHGEHAGSTAMPVRTSVIATPPAAGSGADTQPSRLAPERTR